MQRVTRESLYEDSSAEITEESQNVLPDYGFDFEFEEVEVADSAEEADQGQEAKQEQTYHSDDEEIPSSSAATKTVFKLFSHTNAQEIQVPAEEDQQIDDNEVEAEPVKQYFVDTSARDAEWDQLALERNVRKQSYYIYQSDEKTKSQFASCALDGDFIIAQSTQQTLRLPSDIARDTKKIITNQGEEIKKKNKRGLQSRLKFKKYQQKLQKIKQEQLAKRKQHQSNNQIATGGAAAVVATATPAASAPLPPKKSFLEKKSHKQPKGKPKFRTE